MGTSYKELFKLYDFIQNGDISYVERFLNETKVEINKVIPCKGIGVLHLAVGVEPVDKSKQCTELLLRYSADPNLCNEDGVTPVHIAAIWGRVDNLKLLIGCGGDPSRRDVEGNSAFDYAAQQQQWEVYDYLHNVIDLSDDSIGSECAYTLDLDKVLVSTDKMVAEYEPMTDDQMNNNTRKSEMIRQWCDKNSFTINKLYPTIIGETYLIEDESAPWRSEDFTKNLTYDLTTVTLDDTFKTCMSKKDAEISGVQCLESTEQAKCVCDKNDVRKSVYANFSLPGSPSNICHKNYNTKTSLKKCKHMRNVSKELSEKLTFNEQPVESNDSSALDKASAVVQNKTNEWLSITEVVGNNTRRSSASSGVSSSYSGGSIMLANVQEEYKYEDKEENVVLIEKRLRVSPVVLPMDDAGDNTPDQTILSVASSLPTSVQYDNKALRTELMKLGFTPGPIHESTRTLYLKKLQSLKKTPIVENVQRKAYSIELEKSIRSGEWMNNLSTYIELENKARKDFSSPSKKWREGASKTSFTYLLLDPRLTGNLPEKASSQSHHVSWPTFLNSIFYVGKGKRSRPYSHLYQALTLWKRDFKTSKDKKVQHILDIWSDQVGVVCLHIFQNVIPAEAYTYEAAMIDVLGLANLKNLKGGNYYGAVASWPLKERRMLGMYLLYKAMLIFLSEGERQLRPDDID